MYKFSNSKQFKMISFGNFLFYLLILSFQGTASFIIASESTQNLSEHKSGYTKYTNKLFNSHCIHSMAEFGTENSTTYFIEKCASVTTCEILLPNNSKETAIEKIRELKKHKNWKPLFVQTSSQFEEADSMARSHKDPALHDSTYILEIKEICDKILSKGPIDFIFINPKICLRGDLINELFQRVPIIAAIHTNNKGNVYGWNKIQHPSNYEKIHFNEDSGTTFWIRHDKLDAILALNNNQPPHSLLKTKKKLRIFFVMRHLSMLKSLALALDHLGHTLVLPGNSFDPKSSKPGLKIHDFWVDFFPEKPFNNKELTSRFSNSDPLYFNFLKNVEIIQNDEILTNPPDVLMIISKELENDILKIWGQIPKDTRKNVKLLHFSGNNATHFSKTHLKNLIAVDSYTGTFYDPSKVNIISWIPWNDYDNLAYEGPSHHFLLHSYLFHYYQVGAMPKAYSLFNEVKTNLERDFPYLSVIDDVRFNGQCNLSHHDVYNRINESCGTIHIKETEGFGFSIVESLAKGRPVFLKRSWSIGSRLMNWCIEGKTAFFFDDYEELQTKLRYYLENEEYRNEIQYQCSQIIRNVIDNEKQAYVLERLLQNLK